MILYMAIYGPTIYKKNVFYDGKTQKLFMGRVTGSTDGTGGRTGGDGRTGRVGRPGGWNWVNRYWADLTKNALFTNNYVFVFFVFWVIFGPSRPQKWIRLEILRRIDPTRGLEFKIEAIS